MKIRLVLICIYLFYSCSNSNRKIDTHETNSNSLELQFLKYFEKPNNIIPDTICYEILGMPDGRDQYSACYSYEKIRNGSVTYCIARLKCFAGGKCQELYLISFKNDSAKSVLFVGEDYLDLGYSRSTKYSFSGDTLILTTRIARPNNEGLTVSDSIRFVRYLVDQEGGLKKLEYLK
ncbi:MAG: hypothetical protein JNJ65_05940 [Cyclobacteriaceae bacterium]|nr:hypothetical protein [Cyclobacteriaceae bacterium]